MKRFFFIIVGLLVLGAVGYVAFTMLTTRDHSPADIATYNADGLKITVNYCRPYKKGRVIFGSEADGAIQPWGEYWRIGANEATQITFQPDVLVDGQLLEEGTYWMYAIPGEKFWHIGFNKQLGEWGYSEPDYTQDVLTIQVPVRELTPGYEQLKIEFVEGDNGAEVLLRWDNVEVPIPVSIQP